MCTAPISLLLIPLYAFLISRDLDSTSETLVITRTESRPTWWWANVVTLGVSALVVTLTVFIVLAFSSYSWSWEWSLYARRWYQPSMVAVEPWQWALESSIVLGLGLWAIGTMTHFFALSLRSMWLALVTTILITTFPVTFMEVSAPPLVWWMPGPQFSLALHAAGGPPALWSLGYAIVLLALWPNVGTSGLSSVNDKFLVGDVR